MLDDDKAPTPGQQRQMATGQNLALSAAVHALIATHPDPKAFEAALDLYANELAKILILPLALQHDDGMRQAYSESLRSLRSAVQKR